MPQFELNGSLPDTLDAFTRGYIEAMFFTNGDTGDDNENLLHGLGVSRLTRKSLERIKRDCAEFLESPLWTHTREDGKRVHISVSEYLETLEDYDLEQAGRDLWFTRQGHGVGFWDRDFGTQEQRDRLSDVARAMGEHEVYVSRGWIYAD